MPPDLKMFVYFFFAHPLLSCKYSWGIRKIIKDMNSPRSFKMQKLIVWPQTWKFWFYGVEVRIYAEFAQCICVLCVILNSLDWIHYEGCQLWMVVLLKLTTTKIPLNIIISVVLAKLCWVLILRLSTETMIDCQLKN